MKNTIDKDFILNESINTEQRYMGKNCNFVCNCTLESFILFSKKSVFHNNKLKGVGKVMAR